MCGGIALVNAIISSASVPPTMRTGMLLLLLLLLRICCSISYVAVAVSITVLELMFWKREVKIIFMCEDQLPKKEEVMKNKYLIIFYLF